MPDVASIVDIASATPSTHSQEPAGPGRYRLSHLLPLLPMSDDDDACPMGHASTTGDIQAVPRTSQVPHKLRLTQNLDCRCIHTHVWHQGTTCPFCSLIMSGNDNARSLECATTTEDTQGVPKACEALHKPYLPLHCLSCVVHMKLQSPQQAGRHHCVAAKLHHCCCAPGAQ